MNKGRELAFLSAAHNGVHTILDGVVDAAAAQKMSNRLEAAGKLCKEILVELSKTTDIEEKIILLGILNEKMIGWNVEMKLEQIQRGSHARSTPSGS